MLVQVKDNQVIRKTLPKTGVLSDGRTVSGYNLLSEDVLKIEGWLPLEENKPTHNPDTEYLHFEGYDIQADKVIANYIIIAIPPSPPPEPSPVDYLIDLDYRLSLIELGL